MADGAHGIVGQKINLAVKGLPLPRADHHGGDEPGTRQRSGNGAATSIPATLAVSVIIAAMMNGKVKGQSFYRTVYFLPNVTMVAVVVMIWRWLRQ